MSSNIIYSAGDRSPYTYVITHIKSGQKYYGARYGKNCHPADLWVKYFTSSAHIKKIIQKEGVSAFSAQVRKTFTSVSDCRKWEVKFLKKIDAKNNAMWFNAHNGGNTFYNVSKASEITKMRMSKVRKGVPKSSETKLRMSRWYKLEYDSGETFYIRTLAAVMTKLGKKDKDTVLLTIAKKDGYFSRNKARLTKIGRHFSCAGLKCVDQHGLIFV